MSRLHGRLAIASLAIFVGWIASTTATAQPAEKDRHAKWGPGPPRMGGPALMPMLLLGSDRVQRELKLADEQKAKLKELMTKYTRGSGRQIGDLRGLSDEERRERFALVHKKARAEAEGLCRQIDEVLLPQQRDRFRQILLQVRGVTALGDKQIVETLGLTEQQKQRLKAVGDSAREKLAGLDKQRGELQRQRLWEEARAIQKESTEKALAALTEAQKETFEKLKGPRLDLDLFWK